MKNVTLSKTRGYIKSNYNFKNDTKFLKVFKSRAN